MIGTSAETKKARPASSTPPGRARRSRAATATVVAGICIVVAAVAVATSQWREDDAGVAATVVPAQAAGADGPAPDDPLTRLEQQAADDPDDAQVWAELGSAYVDHARVNADPSAYPKAQQALDRSLAIQPDGNWQALAAHAALAAGRHDFGAALPFAQQARDLQPHSSFILAIVVDSLTELGRYPEAVEATQAMVDLRPDLSSYSRVSYQRELHGDVDGAIVAMEDAGRAASSAGDRSFAEYHLGELEWQRGDVDAAERHYAEALRVDPTAMPAVAGLGKVAAARGDLDAAVARYEEAVAGFPDPETIKELAELQLLRGDRQAAERSFELFAAANATQAAGGVDVNLEIALFSADHGHDLDAGLAAAREEWRRRQSIHVADALGWQLFAHGEHDEALVYADRALQLGTRSATFHFHRAEIHRALGNLDEAAADYREALDINPYFSFLHRDAAQEALADVSG